MSRTNYDVIRKVTANGIFPTRAARIYVLLATSKFQQFAASTDRLSPNEKDDASRLAFVAEQVECRSFRGRVSPFELKSL